jgi:hypothetical protein
MTKHRPNRRSDVRVREVGGETLIFDPQGSLIHQLNHTASYIWERCNGQSTLREITHQVVEAFDVDAQIAAAELTALIRQFHQLNLLEPHEEVVMRREQAGDKENGP